MAHFAELNDSNVVLRVVVIDNSVADTEANGIAKCKALWGADTNWKQTSYNTRGNVHRLGGTPFRKNYAGIGWTYNPTIYGFVAPQPYASWQLNTTTGEWNPPVALPDTNVSNGGTVSHVWDETNRRWNELN